MHKANIISIFVAAPSDIIDERKVVEEVISDWNVLTGVGQGLIAQVTGFKESARPALGGRPQALINKQALKEADILVAVFWTKFGSPTGKAESGTEEEIREAIAKRKKVLLYFADRPLPPSKVDRKQYEMIQRFKADMKNKGIFWNYSDIEEFRQHFRRHIAETLRDLHEEMGRATEKKSPIDINNTISIELSLAQWVSVLLSLDRLGVAISQRTIEELREKGKDEKSLSEEELAAITGPIIARAIVIDKLIDAGVMSTEARKFGASELRKKIEEAERLGRI